MTTFAGALRPIEESAKTSLLTSTPPSNTDMWERAVDGSILIGGDNIVNLPATRPPTSTFDGAVQFSHYNDFYNRVWLIPATLDLGPVTSDLTRQVMMWNANFDAVTIDTISSGDDETVSASGISVGTQIKSLATKTFNVSVLGDGPSDIAATIQFTFDPSEVVDLPVAGVRSKVWAFMPNWRDPVELQIDFMTEIIESRSGYEQRIAVRQEPRLSISFTSIVNDFNYRQFIRQMASWQNKPTLMPDFSHGREIAIEALSGSDTLVLDKQEDWMVVGRTVLIVQGTSSRTEYLVRKIEAVVGNSIRLATTLDRDWPIGTKVFPTYTGYLSSRIAASVLANRTAIVNVNFDADPGYELWSDPGELGEEYLGREIFMLRPDWSDALSPEFEAALETVDYGYGRKANSISKPFNTRYHKANYLEASREQVDDVVNFFRRHKGAQGEFFMPTFTEDLRIKMVANVGTTSLRFDGTHVYQDYLEDLVYKDLMIFYADGTQEAYHVDEIGQVSDENGDDSIISLVNPLLRRVDPDEVLQVCWMPLWRFASDGLRVQWLTDETAQISLSMRALRYVPAES